MANEIPISVVDRKIKVGRHVPATMTNIGKDYLSISLDDEWSSTNHRLRVTLYSEAPYVSVQDWWDGKSAIEIPQEITSCPAFKVTVALLSEDGYERLVTQAMDEPIENPRNGHDEGAEPGVRTIDIIARIDALAADLEEKRNTDYWRGEPGPPGEPGNDADIAGAEAAKNAANNAAINANEAADNANNATANANKATENANNAASNATEAAASANNAANELREAAERGDFDGEPGAPGAPGEPGKDGAPGEPGADGYSPTANVTKDEGTATITITDKNGTTTATVSDGASGAPGAPGADGKTAYQYAVEGGYTGTETEFSDKLAKTPLIGTSDTITVQQVVDAISAGIPIKIQYTDVVDSIYEPLFFTDFFIIDEGSEGGVSYTGIKSRTTSDYAGHPAIVELTGYTDEDGWWAEAAPLAKIWEIPEHLPNPEALIFTGAVTGNYDGSSPKVVNIPSKVTDAHINSLIDANKVTDAHINSLIDAKLGVIENGSY